MSTEIEVRILDIDKDDEQEDEIDDRAKNEILKDKIKGFAKMPAYEQMQYKLPYIQTTLLVYELINLEYEIKGTNVKIKERSGMRKDRFSSLEYNYYVTQQLALKIKPKQDFGNLVKQLTDSSYFVPAISVNSTLANESVATLSIKIVDIKSIIFFFILFSIF